MGKKFDNEKSKAGLESINKRDVLEQSIRLSAPVLETSSLMKDIFGKSGLQKAIEKSTRLSVPVLEASSLMKDIFGKSELQKAIEKSTRLSVPALEASSLMKDVFGKSGFQKAMKQSMEASKIVSQLDWNIPKSLGDLGKISEELGIFQKNIESVAGTISNLPIEKINISVDECIDSYIKKNKINNPEEIKEIQKNDIIAELKELIESSKITYLPEQIAHMNNIILETQIQIKGLSASKDNNQINIKKYSLITILFMLVNVIIMNMGAAIGEELIQEPTKAAIRKAKVYIGEQIKEKIHCEKVDKSIKLVIKKEYSIRNGHRLKAKTISKIYFGDIVVKVGKYRRWSQIVFFNTYGEQKIGWIQSCYLEKIQKSNKK